MSEQLHVSLRVSWWLASVVVASHGVAIAAAVLGLPAASALVVGLGLALSGAHHLRIALHRSPLAVSGLLLSDDGTVALASATGEWTTATLRSASVPGSWLAALRLRDGAGRRRTVLILPDALDPDAFRRLRVWLLWRCAPVPPRSPNSLNHG